MIDQQNQMTDFLLSMSDDLLMSEAINQIGGTQNGVFGCKNFVEAFETKHTIQESQRETDEDENEAEAVAKHQALRDQFYGAIIVKMNEIAGIMIDTHGYITNIPQTVALMYDMFVVRRHENIVDFIVEYIMRNKTALSNRFNDDKITNITVKAARKEFGDRISSTLAVHCMELVDMIMRDDNLMNPEFIIGLLYASSPEDMEYLMAHSMYETVALSFDVPKFVNLLRAIYSDPVNNSALKSNVMEKLTALLKLRHGIIQE